MREGIDFIIHTDSKRKYEVDMSRKHIYEYWENEYGVNHVVNRYSFNIIDDELWTSHMSTSSDPETSFRAFDFFQLKFFEAYNNWLFNQQMEEALTDPI